LYSGGSWF